MGGNYGCTRVLDPDVPAGTVVEFPGSGDPGVGGEATAAVCLGDSFTAVLQLTSFYPCVTITSCVAITVLATVPATVTVPCRGPVRCRVLSIAGRAPVDYAAVPWGAVPGADPNGTSFVLFGVLLCPTGAI